jgi:hypothetical protein
LISSETTFSTHTSISIITDVVASSTRTSSPATVTQSQTVLSTSLASAVNNPSSTFTLAITQLSPTPAISRTPNLSPTPPPATSQGLSSTPAISRSSSTPPEPTSEGPSPTPAVSERTGSLSVLTDTPSPRESTSLETTPTSRANTAETTPTTELFQATPTTTPGITSTGSDDGVFEKIAEFFTSLPDEPAVLIGVILGPVAVILTIVVICVGCCCLRSSMKKNSARFDLAGSTTGASRNGGIGAYRPRSRASVQEMKQYDTDAFYGDFAYQTASQPYHTTMAATTPDAFLDPLPSISPLSYPSQLRHYFTSPEKRDHPSSPTPRISLTQSPNRIRKYPGGSPSLTRPTPLGEQLQRQAERNSTQGSRNSIQGSRASISAMGSRTSFSGSRNSFLSSNNTMSRDEMRSSGFMASNKTMSEGETSSLTSHQPLMRQTSLDMVPTRESPVQLPPPRKRREYKSLTCITNPLAVEAEEESEAREEGDGVDENDLRKDPLVPVMTSTPVNQGAEDLPTKEAKQQQKKAEGSWKATESGSSSTLTTPRKKSLRQLTRLSLPEAEEREGDENDHEVAAASSKGAEGGGDKEKPEKDEKAPAKPMSRLEKLTSLTYNIRSSIRRSLKKKRVSFLTRTPESTPKAKKKTPPRTLPTAEPDLDPDPLMFSNPEAFDTEGPMLSPRIHTPSPLSPGFEGVDDYPQRYLDDLHNPDVYPETHALRHPYPGVGGGGRMRTYSDMPMFAPQLSQPTYYPSTMHYPQPSYPQLSQQYIPPSYGPPHPSPSHRGFGPLSVHPTLQQPLVGSPPHHNLGPLSLPPQPLVGSPPHHAGRPLSILHQPLVGSPPPHGGGPLSHPPHSLVGSPSHRGLGPLSVQPSLHPGFPPEPYTRRYTDSGVSSRSSRGRNERSSGDSRRQNRARSPDALTDTASNVSSQYDRGISPDRFTETSTASELPSPDVYGGFTHGHDGYMDPPIHYRGIPTSLEDQQHLYPHQFYPGSHPYGTGEKSFRGHFSGHVERSVDGPPIGAGNYRQSGLDSQVQSPAHQPHSRHRRASVDCQQGQSRYGSNDTPKHSRHGSTDTPSHSRHGSTSDTPSHSRQGSGDTTNRSCRNSSDMTGQTRRGSTDATPSHSRQGSHDAAGSRDRRGSIENPPPPLASHIRRSSIDNQPTKNRRASVDSHTNGQRHGSVNGGRRSSVEGHPRPRTLTGFQPILEPRPQRNGPRGEGAWQHSQIDEAEEALQYGMGSQRSRMGWDEDNDATPTEHGIMQRAVETSTSSVKTKVSWNNEIIEHMRTPSDSSERY